MPSIRACVTPIARLLLLTIGLTSALAQEPPSEARFAPERGFGMGPHVTVE